MTQHDVRRALDRWFEDGPTESPDRVVNGALLTIDHTQQRGAHIVPWRYSEMPTPIRLLLVAALMVASAGAALFIAGALKPPPSTPEPATNRGPGVLVGSDPQGTWTAQRPAAFGSEAGAFTLFIHAPVQHLLGESPAGQQILLGSVALPETGVVELGPTDRCPTTGRYGFAVATDGNTLTLTREEDACPDRSAFLSGAWDRVWVEWEAALGSRYRFLTPQGSAIDVTIPRSFTYPSGGRPAIMADPQRVWANLATSDVRFWILPGFSPIVDRCHGSSSGFASLATLDAWEAWVGSDAGLETSGAVTLTIDGRDARRVDIAGGDGCDAIWPQMQPLNLAAGWHVRDWAVDLGGRVLLLEALGQGEPFDALSPEILASLDELIASMEISEVP
jgi:hypothetical protein